MERISIRTLKIFSSLSQKKYRQKYQLFAVEGEKITNELISSHADIIDSIIFSDTSSFISETPYKGKCYRATDAELKKISQMSTPPGILCICSIPKYWEYMHQISAKGQWRLLLDGINDPGNMGTIIRTADWFGIREVLLINECVDPLHPKFLQATMGSFLRVKCLPINMEEIKNYEVPFFAATMSGKNVYDLSLPEKGILVMGSESHGISFALLQKVNHEISIPPVAPATVESLNVAVATGILLSFIAKKTSLH